MTHNYLFGKLAAIAALCLVFFSCSNMEEEISVNDSANTQQVFQSPYHLTIDEAQARLEQYIRDLESSDSPNKLHFTSHEITSRYAADLSPVMTRTGGTLFPSVYIFNIGNNQGYSVVSQDSRVQSPYALATTGRLEQGMTKYNYNESIMLQMADLTARQMEAALQVIEPYDPDLDRLTMCTTYYPSGDSDGMCTVKWHQYAPYNAYCPILTNGENASAGGLAVAMAQMMSIFRHPSSYTTTGLNPNESTTFNWTQMILGTETGNDMIAKLMYYLGLPENLNMTYSIGHSHASTANIPHTLENFGYASGAQISRYSANKAFTELSAGRPTIVSHNHGYAPTVYDIMGLRIDYSNDMVTRNGMSEVDSIFMPGVNILVHGGRKDEYKWMPSGIVEFTCRQLFCNIGEGGEGNGWYMVDCTYYNPSSRSSSNETSEEESETGEEQDFYSIINPGAGSGLDPRQYSVLLGVTIVTGIQVAEE